jgi:hypothetical protein
MKENVRKTEDLNSIRKERNGKERTEKKRKPWKRKPRKGKFGKEKTFEMQNIVSLQKYNDGPRRPITLAIALPVKANGCSGTLIDWNELLCPRSPAPP